MKNEIDNVKDIYDAFAGEYRSYSEGKSHYIASIDNTITSRFSGCTSYMFDFGAGDGVRGAELAKTIQPERFVQGDISREMISRCKELGVAHEVWDVSESGWGNNSEAFDLIVSLWNVFGHIPDTDTRIECLQQLRKLCRPEGRLCLDVNNRHNIRYGRWTSLARRTLDFIWPDFSRGNTSFDWEINGVTYPATGHLFTFKEMLHLFKTSGWTIEDWWAVDYDNGTMSKNKTLGQLFFILRPNNA